MLRRSRGGELERGGPTGVFDLVQELMVGGLLLLEELVKLTERLDEFQAQDPLLCSPLSSSRRCFHAV